MNNLLVVSNQKDLEFFKQVNLPVMGAEDYLSNGHELGKHVRVFNLSRDYFYGKKGYYVSLISEARGQKPLPSVGSILELGSGLPMTMVYSGIVEKIQKDFKSLKTDRFLLSIYFGKNLAEKHSSLSKLIFSVFPAPLLRAYFFRKDGEWSLQSVKAISLKDVPHNHREFLISSINEYFTGHSGSRKKNRKKFKYDLALLVNPEETHPPSNEKAIKKFIQAGEQLRIHCELIEKKDFSLLSRFDALFIRETTSVNDHTFQFSQRAHQQGSIVIDDPLSIIRCCNKVYLNDLLVRKKISVPRTKILIHSYEDHKIDLSYPLVIKKPDSSFSLGVKKINNEDELGIILKEFFHSSDLVILQEFLKSDYDWRVGMIDGEPIYVCKYYMAKNHWQIINHEKKQNRLGNAEALAISEVPDLVIKIAKKACESIGTGLYGVDIKEVNGKYFVIEVNDNPSIDKGVEDLVSGDSLYLRIMSSFLRRLEMR